MLVLPNILRRSVMYIGTKIRRILIIVGAVVFSHFTYASNPKESLEQIVFGETQGIHTDAFLILKDGKVLYERYGRGYGPNSKHLSWSMGKTIGGIMAAQAIEAHKFGLNDSLGKWLPKYNGTATILDLFQMSSGIQFKEEYSGIPVDSDATRMLYLDGPKSGFANYITSLPNRSEVRPGDHFYYSSGDAHLLMEVLKNSLNDKKIYDAYPWTNFFDRLDIKEATFEQDSKGTFVGSSYVYMTALQYARIGQMLTDHGKWNNEQIIPSWYFKKMTEVAPGVINNPLPGTSQTRAYSMQTTTNKPITKRNLPSEYPNLPEDALLMIGHQGQLVIASPSEKLVIVRLATDKGDPFNPHRQELFSAIRVFLDQGMGIKIHGAGDTNGRATPVNLNQVVIQTKSENKTKMTDYLKVHELIRALYAKELCTCIFVVERNLADCKDDLKQSLPILPFSSIDEKKKIVTATFTELTHSKAIYSGSRLGCSLIK